ncbi:SH3 domain-containing protein [Luteipulveratus halotolerans]|uniref:SH3b domain-containing protein n=1 Tax=Luteipulveratus halotolerans TaxID=1631356 RepID=A0A0L6CI58_9MICO|nr:SH3 domain-containing protein [Luteipulveratus halotolerans]KNX37419.1 hypothetical protein VV01_10120 [Luteipulveratus halotolerans]
MRSRQVGRAVVLLVILTLAAPSARASSIEPVNRWVSATAANVRTGPSTSYGVVGTVARGTQVTGEVSGSWLRITSYSYRGRYIALSTLASMPVQVTWYVAARDYQVVVRASPSTSAGVVRRLSGGAAVSGRSAGAWFVLAGGGYVSTAVLAPTSDLTAVNGRMPQESLCPLPLARNSPWVGEPGYDPSRVRFLPCPARPRRACRRWTRRSSATPAPIWCRT